MVPSPTKTQPYEARIDGWMDGRMDGHTAAMRPMWQLMHLEQHLLTIWPHSNRNDNSISTSSSSKKREGTQNSRHRLRDRLHFFQTSVCPLRFTLRFCISFPGSLFFSPAQGTMTCTCRQTTAQSQTSVQQPRRRNLDKI